jgi:transposase
MGEVSTIGLDIAKSVFQIHGVDAGGAVVIRKRVTRAKLLEFFASLPGCLVGIEARSSRSLVFGRATPHHIEHRDLLC